MEQLIYIKYINNIINLSNCNNITNLENSETEEKIVSLEILKNKIVILLNTNELIVLDPKSEKFIRKNFNRNFKINNEENIIRLKVFADQIFIIQNTLLKILDQTNLEMINYWDFGEKFYYFCLIGEINSLNIEIIYVNLLNEIKFFSKAYLFDMKIRNLYKENLKIDNILFQNGLLLWSSGLTMKIFDLEKKKMIMRKNYENYLRISNPDKINKTINFLLFGNLICLNVMQKIIFIYKLNNESSLPLITVSNDDINKNIISVDNLNNSNISNGHNISNISSYNVSEIFRSQNLLLESEQSYFLGFWLNSALSKISIIKSCPSRCNSYYKYCSVKLEIYKLFYEDNFKNDTSSNGIEINYTKNFENILSNQEFKFSFSQKYSTVYIFDDMEIYFVTINDKTTKTIEDLKRNISLDLNFNDIFNIFKKLNSFNEKCFIVNKIVKNFGSLLNNELVDQSKILYIFNSVITNEKILNYIILLLIHNNNFEICYSWVNKYFANSSNEIKEKILKYLVVKNKYSLAIVFLNEIEEIKISKKFDEFVYNLATDIVYSKSSLIHIYALINLKSKNIQKGIEFLIKINDNHEINSLIYDMIIKNNCEDFIFIFIELFTNFEHDQLIHILENIFNKDVELKKCQNFYEIFFEKNNLQYIKNDLGKYSKIRKFISAIIEKGKFYLIINSKIAEIIFENLLKIEETKLIINFINNYDKIDYANLLKKHSSDFNEFHILPNDKLIDVLILILNKTEEYERVINIYIEKLKDPEKSINYIENLITISDQRKEELYNYLKNKIKSTIFLSPAKKLYFINLFQDNVLEESQEKTLIEELTQSQDSDDLRFILLILEQLKLKVKILDLTSKISHTNLKKIINQLHKEAQKGTYINYSNLIKCQYNYCESKYFNKGEEIICFMNCFHFYHKYCFEKTNIQISNERVEEENQELQNEIDKNKNIFRICLLCKICSKTFME